MNRKKRLVFFVPIVAVACVEAILLQVCAQFKNVPADNLYLFAVIGILCGCYFWIFAKEKIPAYYDQNKVTAYSDGVFRMNLVSGVYDCAACTLFSGKSIFIGYWWKDRRICINCCLCRWTVCADACCGKKI